MIESFDDFCLWMYVIVDDIWQEIAPQFKRPGPQPVGSDSELLTMALVGESRGWDMETEMLSLWGDHRDLFPVIPTQSRFNRRRRNLMQAFALIRQRVLQMLDVAHDSQCAIDSLPIPVVQFHLVPGAAKSAWQVHGASYGRVESKKVTIFGYKLHLLVTLGGVIIDFALAPAHAHDVTIGEEILVEHTDLTVLGDKGYISAALAAKLSLNNRVRLLTLPKRNQKNQVPKPVRKLFNAVRQIIETVNGQLAAQFNIETNHAHTFWGLCTRLLTKLAAHTLSIYINRLLGVSDFLQIKRLAFPI
jgi:hypothetical protein